ncbi:MAG: aspartate aminotransferase family protein [Peptococcaceae bacterium]|nr:aspartate aminotransferase family protein [Peptococcaceae bacterium]
MSLGRIDVINKSKKYLSAPLASTYNYLHFDRQFVRARGVKLWDKDGKEYLDFVGGYGSVNIGHNHPRIINAIRKIEETPKIIQTALQQLPAALAENLARVTPGNLQRTFFCNSGAEAVEGALKLARIATGRTHFIYCHNSFHGKTFGALSVTGRSKYQNPFKPLLADTTAVPFGDLEALEAALKTTNAAAFIVEPVQGEAGSIVPPDGYLKEALELCHKYGTLLIADEVQTGFGRTGYMFACEHDGIVPDILCIAKALGGGTVPAGAYITTDDIWQKAYGSLDKALLHTSTFGGYWGNAVACAVAIETLQIIFEEDLITNARELGAYFLKELAHLQNKHPMVRDTRGRGLLIGLELTDIGTTSKLLNRLSLGQLDKLSQEYLGTLVAINLVNKYHIVTIFTLNNPNVIRLEPPLLVTKEQIDYVLEALDDIFSKNKSFLSMAGQSIASIFRK